MNAKNLKNGEILNEMVQYYGEAELSKTGRKFRVTRIDQFVYGILTSTSGTEFKGECYLEGKWTLESEPATIINMDFGQPDKPALRLYPEINVSNHPDHSGEDYSETENVHDGIGFGE